MTYNCCEQCDDGDGNCIYPFYGVAPHICHWKIGTPIGQSVLLPKEQWPENFRPDQEVDGLGVYTHCLNCGRGR